jgi:hypothetical protein
VGCERLRLDAARFDLRRLSHGGFGEAAWLAGHFTWNIPWSYLGKSDFFPTEFKRVPQVHTVEVGAGGKAIFRVTKSSFTLEISTP